MVAAVVLLWGALAGCSGQGASDVSVTGSASADLELVESEPADAGTTGSGTGTPPLIATATWTTVDGGDRLVVVPTDHARVWVSHDQAERAWDEVVTLAPAADTPGMAEQFECHLQFATDKASYHLEPWRPAVPYEQIVLAACNPGVPERD